MGKYERDWVEKAEQEVAKALNLESDDKYSIEIANQIKSKLQEKNLNFKKAKWSGGENYDNPGDVDIELENGEIIGVELKFSESNGEGTKANLGQNKFSEYIPGVIGYKEFDERLGLKEERYKLVEQKISKPITSQKMYENNLREIKKSDKEFISKISEITTKGQEEYAKYVAEIGNKNLDKINKFVEDIFNSKHTSSTQKDKDVMYCIVKFYKQPKQKVFFKEFFDVDTNITHLENHGKSIVFYNQFDKQVLRVSVHWKNICQGGATPCFNVFVPKK